MRNNVFHLLTNENLPQIYHQKHDRNLKSEEDSDLLYQLYEKQLRRDRQVGPL